MEQDADDVLGALILGVGVLVPLRDVLSLVSASLALLLPVLLFSLRLSNTGNGLYSSPFTCLSYANNNLEMIDFNQFIGNF